MRTGERVLGVEEVVCTSLKPRTLASGVKAISAVLNPNKITDPKKMDVMLDLWDNRLSKLQAEYNETLSEKMKLAALYGMLPKEFQEKMLDKCSVNWGQKSDDEIRLILVEAKEEMRNVSRSRREASTPTAMEVDAVVEDPGAQAQLQQERHDEYQEEYEIDAVRGLAKEGSPDAAITAME